MERGSALTRAWSAAVCRFRWQVLGAWAALCLVMAALAVQTPGLLDGTGYGADRTPARLTQDLVHSRFPDRRAVALEVVLRSGRAQAGDRAYQAQITAWAADLRRLTQGSAARVEGPVVSADRHTAALVVLSGEPPDRYIQLAGDAARIRHPGPASVYLGGPAAVYDHLIQDSELDLQVAERLALPVAALLLIVVFGGVVAAGLPVAAGLSSSLIALGVLGLVARGHVVSVFALNITTLLGLALAVDYSLLMVSRFREERRAGLDVEAAVAATLATAGRTTLVSGLAVMIGFGSLLLSGINLVWSTGLGGILVVGSAMVASLVLVPALLAAFGSQIDRWPLPLPSLAARTQGFWTAAGRGVTARPLLFLAGGAGLLLLLALPASHLDPAVGGIEELPAGDPARQAQDLATGQLGLPAQQPLLVVAEGVADRAAADRLEAQVRSVSGRPVRGAADVPADQQRLYLRPPYAVYEVTPGAGANDAATRQLLDGLRSAPWPDGVTVRLAGEPAAYQDLRRAFLMDLPRIAGLVLLLTFAVLGLAFRSVAIPLKAVLCNLLSVGAGLGILAFVFQDGHGAGILAFTPTGHIDQSVALVVFAGLFGLSMDYEVFVLSRVREAHLAGASTAEAVVAGLERSGRVVTSAALVMAAVFTTMAISRLAIDKSFGLTFAAAVVIDAGLVRLVVVPAAMAILAGRNWWPGRSLQAEAAWPSLVPAGAPPPAVIPAGAQRPSGPDLLAAAPVPGGPPMPAWIAPRAQGEPAQPPWLTPSPPPPPGPRSSWEVVPHPVRVPSRQGMPPVNGFSAPAPPSLPPPPPAPVAMPMPQTPPPAAAPATQSALPPPHPPLAPPPEADPALVPALIPVRTAMDPTAGPAVNGAAAAGHQPEAAAPQAAPEPGTEPARCSACAAALPAPYMPCPACGLKPEEPAAPPLYILDTVTGLFNQRYLLPQLEYELARVARESSPLGLLLFQAVNATDDALRLMVEVVSPQLRETDLRAVISRQPPRLAVLLPNTDMAQTGHIAGRVMAMASAPPGAARMTVGMVCVPAGAGRIASDVLDAALRSAQTGRPELM